MPFMGIVAYYIDKLWTYRESLIGFEHLEGVHSGLELSKILLRILRKFNIQDRVTTITTDNAANNDVLVSELNKKLFSATQDSVSLFCNKVERIPCLSHVIQLALQALLGSIRISPENDELQRNWRSDDLADIKRFSREANSIPLVLSKVCILYTNLILICLLIMLL